ncbi:hypothetical protein GQ54DRAFT_297353 [Martensiomyces pterosporus]|nr:hypothetical protein GQ54DRAFT_297353 [Martensiomyces pterosporus]
MSTRRQYQEECLFPYTPEQVFSVVADVDRYKEFVPVCVESTVLHNTLRTDRIDSRMPDTNITKKLDRKTVSAELVVGYPPFREKYMSIVAMERPWRVVATAAPGGGMFKHMRTVWEFIDQSKVPRGGPINPLMRKVGTLVKFDIDFEFSSILHAQAASVAFDRMARASLMAYLGRCKKLYG